MVILWKRITGILFAIVVLLLLMRGGVPVEGTFEILGEMGAGHERKGQVERFDHPRCALHNARGHHQQVVNLAIREVGDSGMQSPISRRDPLSVFENQGYCMRRVSSKTTKFMVSRSAEKSFETSSSNCGFLRDLKQSKSKESLERGDASC